jgi:putative flippase GtrA
VRAANPKRSGPVLEPTLRGRAWLKTRQPRRFVVVGASNTLVDYVLFLALAKLLDLPLDEVWVAKLLSGTVAITISFLLNSRWVFRARGGATPAARFLVATMVGVYAIQAPLTQLLATSWRGLGSAVYSALEELRLTEALTEQLLIRTVAFAVATCCSMTFNFLAYRYWVFKRSP